MRFDVRGTIKPIIDDLNSQSQKQVPFATALALTRTAQFSGRKITEEMPRVFNRPTAYTKNAVFIRPATKANLKAEMLIKDESTKAVPAIKWLAPQIYGGGREAKRFELLLRAKGVLDPSQYVVPAAGAKIDAYGNVSRGQLQQILSQLGASRDPLQNRTARSKRRNRRARQFFALTKPWGKLKPGIYERIGFAFGSAVRPVFVFIRQPRYKQRLRFFEIADQTSKMRFPIEFTLAMRQAIATAR